MMEDQEEPAALRFTGIATFMMQPLQTKLEGLDIAIAGVPYDGGVTNRAGTRHGPREIRNASSMTRRIHPLTGIDPYALARIADVGDVPFSTILDIAKSNDDITAFFARMVAAGVIPLAAGGDHSISFPILRAIGAERPVGLIHIDAHTDTWDAFHGSKFHHGGPFRLAVEAGVIDPKRTIQIGIRGAQNFTDGWDYSNETGMRVIFMHEADEIGPDAIVAEARRVVGDGPVYLSFDIDALDPAHAPGTGTPEIGGFTPREAQRIIRGLRGLNFVGADLVEVSPPFDHAQVTALAGATLMYEILCLLAEKAASKKSE
jgi:guanidinopropionase